MFFQNIFRRPGASVHSVTYCSAIGYGMHRTRTTPLWLINSCCRTSPRRYYCCRAWSAGRGFRFHLISNDSQPIWAHFLRSSATRRPLRPTSPSSLLNWSPKPFAELWESLSQRRLRKLAPESSIESLHAEWRQFRFDACARRQFEFIG